MRAGVQGKPTPLGYSTSDDVPRLGRILYLLSGDFSSGFSLDDLLLAARLSPPETFDSLLGLVISATASEKPLLSPWTSRVCASLTASVSAGKFYKPVARKVRPVPTYMPNPTAQTFKPIILPSLPLLPIHPPPRSTITPTTRLSSERLDSIMTTVPEGFLTNEELDLLAFVINLRQNAIAWVDSERGTFSAEYFPDYEIPVIEHVPWQRPPMKIPKALEDKVRALLAT